MYQSSLDCISTWDKVQISCDVIVR